MSAARAAQPRKVEPAAAAPPRKWDRRREEVILAAASVFAEKGYHAATTRDIADRLNLLPGSLYYYLPSKEAALVEVCRLHGRAYIERLRAIAAGDDDFAAKVRAAMQAHIVNNRDELRSAFTLSRHDLPPAALDDLRTLRRDYFRLWRRLFEQGVANGGARAGLDTKLAAVAAIAICNAALDGNEGKPPAEAERIAAVLADQVLGGMAR